MVAICLASRWLLSDLWNNAGFLELASAASTLILIIGAVIEEWSKLKQIGLLTAKLLLFRATAFERCVLKKLVLHSVGAILVVAGIVGELFFETRTFIVEDRETAVLEKQAGDAKASADGALAALNEANRQLGILTAKAEKAGAAADAAALSAGKAETKASEAGTKADSANHAAENAEGKSDKATEAAFGAQNLANDARSQIGLVTNEIADANRALESERTTRLQFESDISPRPNLQIRAGIGKDGKSSNLEALSSYAGQKARIEYVPEYWARRNAIQLFQLLSGLKWDVPEPVAKEDFEEGVTILSSSQLEFDRPPGWNKTIGASGALATFLRTCKWDATNRPTGTIPATDFGLVIKIGVKPSAYFEDQRYKDGMKSLQEMRANEDRQRLSFLRAQGLEDNCSGEEP